MAKRTTAGAKHAARERRQTAAAAAETAAASPAAQTPAALHALQAFTVQTIHRSQLKEAPYNPRHLSDGARRKLRAGIERVGLVAPLTWNKRTGHLVGGHQRLAQLDALAKSGDYTLDVAVVDLDVAKEKAANLLLNNPEAQGEWDLEKLHAMLQDEAIDLPSAGFDVSDVYQLLGDDPLTGEQTNELAERLQQALQVYEEKVKDGGKGQERDSEDFYSVLVFRDPKDRNAFLTACGIEPNKFVDGRVLWQVLRPSATTAPADAPSAATADAAAAPPPAAPRARGRRQSPAAGGPRE